MTELWSNNFSLHSLLTSRFQWKTLVTWRQAIFEGLGSGNGGNMELPAVEYVDKSEQENDAFLNQSCVSLTYLTHGKMLGSGLSIELMW